MPAEALEIPYPAPYTFRIIGRASSEMLERIRGIVCTIVGLIEDDAVSLRPSSHGNYAAIHVTCVLVSEEQRREVYVALKADPDVIMTL